MTEVVARRVRLRSEDGHRRRHFPLITEGTTSVGKDGTEKTEEREYPRPYGTEPTTFGGFGDRNGHYRSRVLLGTGLIDLHPGGPSYRRG